MRQRDKVFGMELGHDAEPAVTRESHMKAVGDVDERNAFGDYGARRVDNGDFRLRRRPIAVRGGFSRGIRIDMRDVETAAVGRWRDVAGATARGKPLLLRACPGIQYRDVVRDAIGDEQAIAFTVLDDAGEI